MAYTKQNKSFYTLYHNQNGTSVGTVSGKVIERDGFIFKDLEGTGELLPYEDWRLTHEERARDLAARLSIEELAGLMMYSPHQMVPSRADDMFPGTYGGKPLEYSGEPKWALTDQQKGFLKFDHVRHVLAAGLESAEIAARWSNELQAFVEGLPHGIPVNISSDPRNGAADAAAEFKSGASDLSRWPEGMGMAAAFSPEKCREYAQIISKEYRAMGMTTSLSPQIDTATEPRWMRLEDTFGCDPALVRDYARAYCDGMQTTDGAADGWGGDSVCTMSKHWPGGGSGEGGRDAHYPYGRFAVYPGKNFDQHMTPFLDGAFKLEGATGCTCAIMPYYTVSWGQDAKYGKNVGNSYSKYIVSDLLRDKYGYDGVVCTDWGITADPLDTIDSFSSRCYGVEELTEAQRHFLALEVGVDQFGGNSCVAPILEAYKLGCEKYGEDQMRARMERSAVRLLRSMFRCGLFDDPYLDVEQSVRTVGCAEFAAAGFAAQLASIVMLKNNGALPVKTGAQRKKVYIPNRHIDALKTFFRTPGSARDIDPAKDIGLEKYFERVESPDDADVALVFMESPLCECYSADDLAAGGNGYLPITLQYRPYTAVDAREHSIAGGDFRESSPDRGYRGKSNRAANEADLDNLLAAKRAMGDKPVIACIRLHNPTVMAELEPYADAILAEFGVQKTALLDIITGRSEPSGLLPVQLPASMETVEKHCEDVPFDMEVYVDSRGNAYQYGFGLNWSGRIIDERTAKYRAPSKKRD